MLPALNLQKMAKNFNTLPSTPITGANKLLTLDGDGDFASTTVADVAAALPDDSITNAKIGPNAVGTSEITDGAVTTPKLSNSGATAGTYGAANKAVQIAVDAKGRITSAAEFPIAAGGEQEYDAGNGCIVAATGPGITFARPDNVSGVFSIPSGVRLKRFDIYNQTNPGTTYSLTFNHVGNTLTNQSAATARAPFLQGFRLGGASGSGSPSPAPYSYVHAGLSGTTTLISTISAVGGGNITVQITNYSTALQANQSLLSGKF